MLHADVSIISTFSLPESYVDKHCDKYYLLHWSGPYLASHLLSNYHKIIREDISYLPIFDGIKPFDVYFSQPKEQFILSFRKKKQELFGYVIIRRLTQ